MEAPIFLISLPRSGSTLIQRVLMSHKDIHSVSEPWLLLPMFYPYAKPGVISEYSSVTCRNALADFIEILPSGDEDYREAIRDFSFQLYQKQCRNKERYFLDKTPRYYHILPEMAATFPNAKFIFLFRNPVHIFSSVIQTWGNGGFRNLHTSYTDIYDGPSLLSKGYELLKSKSYALKYEDFVAEPERYAKELCEYLDIEFSNEMISGLGRITNEGRMGDPTGIKEYSQVSAKSLEKWKVSFNSPFRKRLLTRYIHGIDSSVFFSQGYSKDQICKEIKSLLVTRWYIPMDRMDYAYTCLIRLTKVNLYLGNDIRKWAKRKFLS